MQAVDVMITRCVSAGIVVEELGNFYPSLTRRIGRTIEINNPYGWQGLYVRGAGDKHPSAERRVYGTPQP